MHALTDIHDTHGTAGWVSNLATKHTSTCPHWHNAELFQRGYKAQTPELLFITHTYIYRRSMRRYTHVRKHVDSHLHEYAYGPDYECDHMIESMYDQPAANDELCQPRVSTHRHTHLYPCTHAHVYRPLTSGGQAGEQAGRQAG